MVDQKPYHSLAVIGFAVLLLLSSLDTVLKYTGLAGVAAFFIMGTAAIFFCLRFVVPALTGRISDRTAVILAAITILVLAVIAIVGYPIANSGAFGAGGDVDDAMIAAAREVAAGNYPYYQRTYLGLLISPLPGAIFLAIPFVLTGVLQLQNVFWLGALFVAARNRLKSGTYALGLLWTVIVLAPTLFQGLVTGSDYISNTIYILIPMWLMIGELSDENAPVWKKLLPAILLGIGLSSRTNFLLIMPLFFSVLVQNAPWREVIKYLVVAAAVCAAITIPYWLYDPTGFAPLISQASKVRELETILPFAGILIPGTTFGLACALSLQRMGRDGAVFFRNAAIVQLFVLLFTSIVFAIQRSQLNFYMAHAGYGMFVLFFAAASAWITISKRAQNTAGTVN